MSDTGDSRDVWQNVKRKPVKDNLERTILPIMALIGKQFGYNLHSNPRTRAPMPIRMLRYFNFVEAANELERLPWYPR